MARPKSSDICPKCGRQGFLRMKPTRNGNYPNAAYSLYRYFVHHGSKTEKRKECYVEDILRKLEKYIFTGPDGKLRYEIIHFYRKAKVDWYRAMKRIMHDRQHVIVDPEYFQFLMKPTNNNSLWAIIQNIATKNSEWAKQYPDLREFKDDELKINKIKSRCVKDMIKVSSFLIKKDPTLTLDRLTRTFWKIHTKQNNKNREYLLKRFNRFRQDIRKAPEGLVPFMISLELLFLTDIFPEIIQNKRNISSKLSESAFGSLLYEGTILSSHDN